jgi:hypothetical protein
MSSGLYELAFQAFTAVAAQLSELLFRCFGGRSAPRFLRPVRINRGGHLIYERK